MVTPEAVAKILPGQLTLQISAKEMVGFEDLEQALVQAAIGREQLKRLPAIVERRRELAAVYAEHLRGIPGVVPATEPAWARTNWQSYTVRLQPPLDQRRVMQRMLDEGISTRRGVMNAHREPAYPPGSWRAAGPLTRGEQAQDTVIVLPLEHQMTSDDQPRVVSALRPAVSASG